MNDYENMRFEKQRLHRNLISLFAVNKFITQMLKQATFVGRKLNSSLAYYEMLRYCNSRLDMNKTYINECYAKVDEIKKQLEENPTIYNTGELYEPDAR
jgi:trans-aconitate methyltransferase